MRRRLSIYARTLLTISAAILAIFLVLGFTYGAVYLWASNQQHEEELTRNAVELSYLTENRMDGNYETFTSADVTGYLAFATRSTGAYVWVVNAHGDIIYHTGMPRETMERLERRTASAYSDFILPVDARNGGGATYCDRGEKTGFVDVLPEAKKWLIASAPMGKMGDIYTGEVILLKRHQPDTLSAFLLDNNVPISFAIAFILSLLIIFWLSRNITRPISALAATADRVYRGDLTARVQLGKEKKPLMLYNAEDAEDEDEASLAAHAREDDLTRLVRTFNTLIAKFEEREDQHTEFLRNVSHDLRTPITSIGGFVEGLRDGTVPPERADYYLGIIKAEVDRLESLINTLFEQAEMIDPSTLSMTVFDVNDWIRRTKQTFEPMLKAKRLHLELRFDENAGEPVRGIGDVEQLTRVLNNIVANAVRYAPTAGIVMIQTRVIDRTIRVSVEDNGEGFAEAALPYVFDRFYKADKSRHEAGSGLGLYIARALIKRHGQQIEAGRSAELGGARVTFTIERP
ncbi:MAG: ATP-binding protein [Saccharofermentanales bacterium]|jgi:signal transduction histidine kinase